MAKLYKFEKEARDALFRGVELLSKTVVTTLGPKGRNVALDKMWSPPVVLHDGVKVAKDIDLEDPFENMGAQLVKEAATKTNDTAGDGTTASILLAYEIVRGGLKFVKRGANPMSLKKGIDLAVERIVEELKEMSQAVDTQEKIEQIATISSTIPEVGKMIGEAMIKVGVDGVVTVDEGTGIKTEVEYKEGMEFDKGYVSPQFASDNSRKETTLQGPYIFFADQIIDNPTELVNVFEMITKEGKSKGIVVIANGYSDGVIQTLLVNKARGTLNPLAIIAPGIAERRSQYLEDMAVLCGGKVAKKEMGVDFEYVNMEYIGRCEKVVCSQNRTQIVGGLGARGLIEDRIKLIKALIKKEESDFEKEKLQERLAKLTGGAAVIKVGAQTEIQLNETKERVIDAVEATKSAVEEGFVMGAGMALKRIAITYPIMEKIREEVKKMGVEQDVYNDIIAGVEVVFDALLSPYKKILTNAGYEPKILEKARSDEGIDVETGKKVRLIKAGIIDPTKVVRSALQNASSIAGMILTTEVLIAHSPQDREKTVSELTK